MSLLNQGLFFIDDRGKCVIAQRRRDARKKPLAEDSEILHEAVEQAGWVAIFAEPHCRDITIQFDLRSVREQALTELGALFLRYPFKAVTLSYKSVGWHRLRFTDGMEAAAGLWRSLRDGDIALERARFERQPLSLEALAATPEDARQEPFSALLSKWRDTGGRYFPGLMPMIEGLEVADRTTAIAVTRDHPSGVFQYLGACTRKLHGGFADKAVGAPVLKHPDAHYARWVGGLYQKVSKRGEPSLETVNFKEHINGVPGYDTLRLPWRDGKGTTLVTSFRIDYDRGGHCCRSCPVEPEGTAVNR